MVVQTPGLEDTVRTSGSVRVETYDPAICRYIIPWWDALSKRQKLRESQHIEPLESIQQRNTTCVELHYLFVDMLDGSQTVNEIIDAVAVGRSDAKTAEGDKALNDHVADLDITAYDDRSATLRLRIFIDTDEANVDTGAGETLSEAALKAGEYFLSHSLFSSDIAKDETVQVTVSYDLSATAQ